MKARSHADSPQADILTVDCEDWFHILRPEHANPETWSRLPSTVERDTEELLDLLDRHRARATFFVLGWTASRAPNLVREIARRGHEIASHGYAHVPPDDVSESEFRRDLLRSVELLQDLAGGRVRGYRAPGFGVRRCRYRYLDVLSECGLEYDASLFPGWYPGRGAMGGTPWPYRRGEYAGGIWEVPMSAVEVLGVPVAFSGGGFLRLLPWWCVRFAASRVRAKGHPTIFYLHPRDLNPDTPMVATGPWSRWRYYGGRKGMRRRLSAILEDGHTTSIEDYLGLGLATEGAA